jgi:O-antigen ligase
MAIVGCYLLTDRRKIMTLAWLAVLAQGFNAWEVNMDYFQHGWSMFRLIGRNALDNNGYSNSSIPIMAISLAMTLTLPKWWQRAITGFVLVLQMHQIMLLESRGAFLGSLFMGLLAFVFVRKTFKNVFAMVVAVTIGAVLAGQPVIEEFSTIFTEAESSGAGRFALWSASWQMMSANPITGVGLEAEGPLMPRFGFPYGKDLHNLFFDAGVGAGFPGAVLYVAYYAFIWLAHWRLHRRERRALADWARCINMAVLIGMPSYWLSSMFTAGMLIESPYVLTILGATTLLVIDNEKQAEAWNHHRLTPALS